MGKLCSNSHRRADRQRSVLSTLEEEKKASRLMYSYHLTSYQKRKAFDERHSNLFSTEISDMMTEPQSHESRTRRSERTDHGM